MQAAANNPAFIAGPGQDNRTGTITEKNAGIAVLPVYTCRKRFRPNEQDFHFRPIPDIVVRHIQPIGKPGTGGIDVVGKTIFSPQLRLHETGGGWHDHVGGNGGNDDQIQFLRIDTGDSQRPSSRLGRQLIVLFTATGDMATPDTSSRCDPFIRSFNHLLKFSIGDNSLGQAGSCA
jgi:hypothetical protein